MDEYQYFIEYFKQFPILIQLVWFCSSVLFLVVILLIGYLKYLRNYLRKNEKIKIKYQNEYEALLITYLYAGNENGAISTEQQSIINKLKVSITDRFKRKIVVSILLKLRNEISGEVAESIQKLYFETGLINFALFKLKSKKWYVVAKGIRELTQFHVKEIHDKIIVLVNHPKREVRKEVQLYLVNLFHFEGLKFLNELKTSLSEWDQIQLLELLQRFQNQQIVDITPWLKSTNNSVVFFSLKLAKIYNQFEAKDELINLLAHKNKNIRVQAIEALSHLQISEAKKVLKTNFNKRSLEEQVSFFRMLENTFDYDDESFLLEHIHHKNFEIKLQALKILKILNVDKLKSLKPPDQESEFYRIIKFVENN